ncbi:hypothetical protein [Fundicoccus culcitae]|uniref:YolD-like family protein n=1 Tax=Fundicoccus culcitae TaxID=2969821 RepID=A0ABY5P6G3_9LACT|nr:hypothetical protein [Fundicoccus culcitae]UUX34317.1 hypothetical protein NRE15_01320 [Fundicoccus culcitae]
MKYEKMNDYHDRGMMKWQGMILSEHRSVLEQETQAYRPSYQAPIQQNRDEIIATLKRAHSSHYRVWIALNQLDANQEYIELKGRVFGFENGQLIIEKIPVNLELIRCVEFVDSVPFWKNHTSEC